MRIIKRGKTLNLSYIIEQFSKNWNDWRWYYYQFTNQIVPKYYVLFKNVGIYILDENWDNLIILDACRFDVFKEKLRNSQIKGKLEKRISRGSSTLEFLLENFANKEKYKDVVYITANPYVHTILNSPFHNIINVWIDLWDEEKETVTPEEMTKVAIHTKNKYPDKRLIIHFMQPHSPFIGTYRKEGNFWQLTLKDGLDTAIKAYKSNLDIVFPYVAVLSSIFIGKTVVTADHGEAFGEVATPLKIPIYGHPNGVHIPALVEVPWLIVES